MVGLIRRVTENYELQIPNYDVAGWGTAMSKNFDILDAALFAVTGYGNIRGEWENSILYTAGDRVVDTDDGGIWQALVTHTSDASGTFADDRAAHPTYWTRLVGSVSYRGQWTTATNYNSNEFMYYDHQYAVGTQFFTSGASFAADVAAGKIIVLIDLRADLASTAADAASALSSKNAAATSATNAATSATNAATSATNAANSASAAATSASSASTSAATATTKASEASASAAAALSSQNAAAASATAANNSAIDAAASALAAQTWDPTNYNRKDTNNTWTGSQTFGDGNLTDGEMLITFNTDRPWLIRQRGETGTAQLSFENTTSKRIEFSNESTYAGPRIALEPSSTPKVLFDSTNFSIANMVSGASSSQISITTSDTTTSANGAWIVLYGVDHSGDGDIVLSAGGPTGEISLRTNSGSTAMTIGPSSATFVLPITFNGLATFDGGLYITSPGEVIRFDGAAGVDNYMTWYQDAVRTAYIRYVDGTSSGQGFQFFNDVTDDYLYLSNVNNIDALKFYDSSVAQHNTIWHSGNLAAADLNTIYGYTPVNPTRNLVAGNGLTGGGNLTADRTFTMGTPSSISNSSTNSVTATSHTHALAFTAAEVYTGTSSTLTSYPVGTPLLVHIHTAPSLARNEGGNVYYMTSPNYAFSRASAGGVGLSGVWNSRGEYTDGEDLVLMQRSA